MQLTKLYKSPKSFDKHVRVRRRRRVVAKILGKGRKIQPEVPTESELTIPENFGLPFKIPYFIILMSLFQVALFYFGHDVARDVFMFLPSRRLQIWRYFTSILVHSSPVHLWENIIPQLLFGSLLEMLMDRRKVLIIYILGGLSCVLGSVTSNPHMGGLGCCGSLYAVIGALSLLPIIKWHQPSWRYVRFPVGMILSVKIAYNLLYIVKAYSTLPDGAKIVWEWGYLLSGLVGPVLTWRLRDTGLLGQTCPHPIIRTVLELILFSCLMIYFMIVHINIVHHGPFNMV